MLHYTNNATTTLSIQVQAADTTINVASTAKFPQGVDFGGGDYFFVTLYNALSKDIEICKVTGMTPVAFTVVRGQDGTLATDFDLVGTVVERRAVAHDYENFVQTEELTSHTNAADPHPQYATDTALTTAIGDHEAAADPHPGYATDAALTSAITAHTQAADPHPGYATDSDVSTAIGNHVAAANPHSQYATNTYVNDQVAQHEAKTNPHPAYTKAATNSDITAKTSAVLAITPSGLDHMWNRQAIERGVTISNGAPSVGKFPLLDETGKLDLSIIPTVGGTTYRGTVDAVNNPPPSLIYYAGDFFYHVGTTDTIDPNWTGIVGETVKTGDELVWTGTEWSLIPALDDSSLYLFKDGSNAMTGDLNMNGNELVSGVIDCGTF
jgi:hypothetical protein